VRRAENNTADMIENYQRVRDANNRLMDENDLMRRDLGFFGSLQTDYNRLRADHEELLRRCSLVEQELQLKDLFLLRIQKEKEVLVLEQGKKEKQNQKIAEIEKEISKLQEMAKSDTKRRKELEEAIARREAGIKALVLEVDVTPPNWASSWLTVRGHCFEHRLDERFQLESPGRKGTCDVAMKERPFSKGTFRLAYFGKDGGRRVVFKKLIFSQNVAADHREHEENLKLHLIASYFAEEFNKNRPRNTPTLKYVGAKIYSFADHLGTEMSLFGEEVLEGAFTKYNSNGEYVNRDPEAALPQTFSHFTYIHSGGKLVICDIQGCFVGRSNEYVLTDPACHQLPNADGTKEFGGANLGEAGFRKFFGSHECNQFCHIMGLTPHPSQPKK